MKSQPKITDRILYKDRQCLVINKHPGELSRASGTEEGNLHHSVMAYCKHPVHPVNQLDRPVSGALLFAMSKKSMEALTNQFQKGEVEKHYLGIVARGLKETKGTFTDQLIHDQKTRKAFVVDPGGQNAKTARTDYEIIGSSENYDLLHLVISTGRFHQIRAQLGHRGFPLKGDVKYGFRRSNKDRGIHLHSWKMAFTHPTKNQLIKVTAPLPDEALWNVFREQINTIADNT